MTLSTPPKIQIDTWVEATDGRSGQISSSEALPGLEIAWVEEGLGAIANRRRWRHHAVANGNIDLRVGRNRECLQAPEQ